MTSDLLQIRAGLRIDRPLDDVRAHIRDVDHRIRTRVHRGLKFSWLPGLPGQRKVRMEFLLMGHLQEDVAYFEDAPDGSVVVRVVEGANAGTDLAYTFREDAASSTYVELTAQMPRQTLRGLLGWDWEIGLKKALERRLYESKRDIEQGEHQGGRAAGDLKRALGFLRGAVEKVQAAGPGADGLARAILEAATLAAVADGESDRAEEDALRAIRVALDAPGIDDAWMAATLADAKARARSAMLGPGAEELGQTLRSLGAAREGLYAAALVVVVSHGVGLAELALLHRLAGAAGLGEADAEQAIAAIDHALMRE